MASLIKNRFSVTALAGFITEYGLGSSGNNMYMSIGRDSAWSNDLIPPTPLDNTGSAANNTAGQSEYGLQVDVHATKLIPLANIQPVVPRRNWASGVEYNAVRTDISDPMAAGDFYVMNSSSQVWICTNGYRNSDGVAGGTAVSSADGEPYKPSPIVDDTFTTGTDGYAWKYLYTVSGISSNAVTTNWMPVNYGTTVTGNDNADSNIELGCDHLMIIGEFDSSVTVSAGDDEFRQVGIYINPVLSDGSTAATLAVYNDPQTDLFSTGGATANIGKLMYHENRTPVVRSASQIEQVKVVVEF